MTKFEKEWEKSPEYKEALRLFGLSLFVRSNFEPRFERTRYFRDARLAFRKRVNGGYSKGDH